MLPRSARLKRNRDFKAVYAQRRSYSTGTIVLYVKFKRDRTASVEAANIQSPSGGVGNTAVDKAATCRIGFVISKKVAKRAHDRNLLKRRLREICRHRVLPRLRKNVVADIMLVTRSGATELDFARLAADVETLGRQAGLFAQ